MSFNVSRFLVRVRQFWTRERLVPVLGVTAIFLFLLNFYTYLKSEFEKRPIVAIHSLDLPADIRFESENRDNVFIFRHDHNHDEAHLHEHERVREAHRKHIRKRMRMHRGHPGDYEIEIRDFDRLKDRILKDVLIDRDESAGEIRIEINGEVLTIDDIETEI